MIAHKIHSGTRGAGMVSSLVFAPNQGIQLVDPAYLKELANNASKQTEYAKLTVDSSRTTASRQSFEIAKPIIRSILSNC